MQKESSCTSSAKFTTKVGAPGNALQRLVGPTETEPKGPRGTETKPLEPGMTSSPTSCAMTSRNECNRGAIAEAKGPPFRCRAAIDMICRSKAAQEKAEEHNNNMAKSHKKCKCKLISCYPLLACAGWKQPRASQEQHTAQPQAKHAAGHAKICGATKYV